MMAWNDTKEMADYCYTIDEPDMAEEILKLGTRIAELQAQVDADEIAFTEVAKSFDADRMQIEQLEAQLLAVTNENRKLLDPNGELLPPLTAIDGEE